MVEKITKYKKYIISIVLISVLAILFMNIKYLLPKKYGELPEVKLREIKNSRSFAIMVPNESGDGYVEYKSEDNAWPGDEYDFKEAKCTDNNGTLIEDSVIFEDGKATLTTNKTIYCTLYFDEKTTINILRKYDTNKVISKDLIGDLYRYQGLDIQYANDSINNPENYPIVDNNYICFGTNNQKECIDKPNKYIYRIIGISKDGKLKLIKETFLEEGDIVLTPVWNNVVNFSNPYDGKTGDCDEDKCEWPNVIIFKRLNGISNGTTIGDDGDSNIFIGTKENPSSYEYLTEGNPWYNKIEDHDWMYGDTNENQLYNGFEAYNIESGKRKTKRNWIEIGQTCSTETPCVEKEYTWSKSINAKIGLMYMHDYLMAYPTSIPDINSAKKSWIFFQNNSFNNAANWEWTMSRGGISLATNTPGVIDINYLGQITIITWMLNTALAIRPVFYLNPDINIINGSGIINDPFILEA